MACSGKRNLSLQSQHNILNAIVCQMHISYNYMQMEGKKLQSTMDIFRNVPQCLSSVKSVNTVIQFIDTCVLLRGHNDERFVSYIMSKKGKIMDNTGTE